MSWKDAAKDYLHFSKKDRIGGLIVIGLIGLVCLLPVLTARRADSNIIVANDILKDAIDTAVAKRERTKESFYNNEEEHISTNYEPKRVNTFVPGTLFTFDPNTLPADGWKRLGLNDKTIKTLINYRSKGGKFYKPEDLQKIWGLPDGFYDHVKSYMQIELQRNSFEKKDYVVGTYPKRERKTYAVNINEGDTSAFIELPGIGSKLALRIVNFRDKLGGFYSVEQVGETYGLPDSTFQKIKDYLQPGGTIKKININAATKDELKVHPYIKWNLANAIVEYRNQHGGYKSLDELKNIVLIDEVVFSKIVNYLSL